MERTGDAFRRESVCPIPRMDGSLHAPDLRSNLRERDADVFEI
jgi:hypothetical protein